MSNANLHNAKTARLDEFYTRLPDIRDELWRYRKYTEGKVIYSPCDGPYSNFVRYFQAYSHCYEAQHLHCANDFRSEDSLARLDRADIVITNPPFSLIGEFLQLLIDKGKDFLIVAPLSACHRKNTFELIKQGKLRLGCGFRGKAAFRVPDNSDYINHKRYDSATGLVHFGNIVWLTTMEYALRAGDSDRRIYPTAKYNPDIHLCYQNYRAINVDKVADIPADYIGVMGVPVSYLERHNPHVFDIVGITTNWGGDEHHIPDTPKGAPILKGKARYVRILIRRRHINADERQPAEGKESP